MAFQQELSKLSVRFRSIYDTSFSSGETQLKHLPLPFLLLEIIEIYVKL
jgi:hypothetical protein